MPMLSVEIKENLNNRVFEDCKLNGVEIVAERMKICNFKITLHGEFIENFTGDSYDLQQRKAELQKIVWPLHRVKLFEASTL